jgi:hypothetical protein
MLPWEALEDIPRSRIPRCRPALRPQLTQPAASHAIRTPRLAQIRDVLGKVLVFARTHQSFARRSSAPWFSDAWSLLAPTENNRRCRESVSCFREALRSYSSAESRRAVAWEQEVFVYRGTGALSLKRSLGALNYTVKTIRTVPPQFYRKDRKGRSRALRQPDGPRRPSLWRRPLRPIPRIARRGRQDTSAMQLTRWGYPLHFIIVA